MNTFNSTFFILWPFIILTTLIFWTCLYFFILTSDFGWIFMDYFNRKQSCTCGQVQFRWQISFRNTTVSLDTGSSTRQPWSDICILVLHSHEKENKRCFYISSAAPLSLISCGSLNPSSSSSRFCSLNWPSVIKSFDCGSLTSADHYHFWEYDKLSSCRLQSVRCLSE